MSVPLTKRQEAWLYLVLTATALIGLFGSWRYALAFFLGTGAIMNLIKLIRGKAVFK